MALGIENNSRGRFAINLVNTWNRPELEKAGIDFAEHDQRYAYGPEWISIVSRAIQKQNTDPKVVMMQTMQKTPPIGGNGRTATGLIGSYDEVASRIIDFGSTGIELFMLRFQPFEAEMARLAEEIIPRVRQTEANESAGWSRSQKRRGGPI